MSVDKICEQTKIDRFFIDKMVNIINEEKALIAAKGDAAELKKAKKAGFSDKEIASPCAKKIDILMAMNAPAIDKFESSLRPGGLLLVNSSLVHEREYRDDIRVVKVPMTEIAAEHENPRGANIVMMGAMAANSDLFTEDDLERLINEFFEKKGKINPKNSLCFRAGTQIH